MSLFEWNFMFTNLIHFFTLAPMEWSFRVLIKSLDLHQTPSCLALNSNSCFPSPVSLWKARLQFPDYFLLSFTLLPRVSTLCHLHIAKSLEEQKNVTDLLLSTFFLSVMWNLKVLATFLVLQHLQHIKKPFLDKFFSSNRKIDL